MDWKAEIAKVVYWKQMTAEHDKKKAIPWHLPNVAAPISNVLAAEKVLGKRLSSEYKEFLTFADGWLGFFVSVDLFGTQEIVQGKSQLILERAELLSLLMDLGIDKKYATVIGASDFELDVFIHMSPDSAVMPGGVIWVASEEVDRYDSFAEFFSSMVNYNARTAEKMRAPVNLLELGQQKCHQLQTAYPSSVTLQSIGNQIDYLLELARGTSTDRSRLKDIIIGVQTAREVEALDSDAAEVFYKIASAAKTM